MAWCRTWTCVAAVTALVCSCAAEDSVAPNVSPIGGGAGGNAGTAADATGGVGGSAGAQAGTAADPQGMASPAGTGAGASAGTGTGGVAGDMVESGGMGAGTVAADAGPSGGGGGSGGGGAFDADCDMNGIWAVRMMSVVEALGLEQCGNIYYYMEFRQEGEAVEVVNHFNCGIEGRGTANSSFSDATTQALLLTNSQVGRKGTMRKGADGTCQFNMEPFWAVLGADEAAYSPTPRNSAQNLSEVQASNPLPTVAGSGVIDVENDGHPGAAFIVTGALTGKRHAIQRNVEAWLTNDRYKVMPALDWPQDFDVRADYIGEALTLETEPPNNALLAAGANPVRNAAGARVTLRFLGRDVSDPRVAGVVVSADPSADPQGATQTCGNIITALQPIVPLAFPNPQVCPCPGGGICM